MPSRMYVFTFGWSPEFVIQPLLREGIEKDDFILLLTNKPESEYARRKFEEAYQQVVSFLKYVNLASRVAYREVSVERDFMEICLDIAKILNEELARRKPDVMKVYLSGGMRVLILATLLVVRLLHLCGENVEIYTSMENRPVTYAIPIRALTIDPTRITTEQLEILKILGSVGEAPVEALAVRRARDTARKLLGKLVDRGLVAYRARGRRYFYFLTLLGRLITLCSEG